MPIAQLEESESQVGRWWDGFRRSLYIYVTNMKEFAVAGRFPPQTATSLLWVQIFRNSAYTMLMAQPGRTYW
jgi:hypothetical protein